MPKVIKTPNNPYIKKGYRFRVYRPEGNFDREYKSMNQMKRFKKYYKSLGFRTRAI